MKQTLFFAFILTAAISSTAQTESVSSTTIETSSGVSGIRVGLAIPSFTLRDKWSLDDQSTAFSEKVKSPLGFTFGYANLPVQEFGYTANIGYMNFEQYKQQATLLRLDANAGYAFTELMNFKGGINLSKFTSGEFIKDLSPSIGFQASVGFQITKVFGVDVAYTKLKQTGTVDGFKVEAEVSGAEINLNGTF